jgi:large subunit ribosomal protein L49
MSLSFLRPLALPRASTLTRFLGIAKVSTTTASSITPPAPSAPAKPYRVERTGSNNLPVYLLSKRGGNLKQTRVRRIEGKIAVLRAELQELLKVDESEVTINQLTQQIIIKVSLSSCPYNVRSLTLRIGPQESGSHEIFRGQQVLAGAHGDGTGEGSGELENGVSCFSKQQPAVV